jgi:hypothetical protein
MTSVTQCQWRRPYLSSRRAGSLGGRRPYRLDGALDALLEIGIVELGREALGDDPGEEDQAANAVNAKMRLENDWRAATFAFMGAA